MESNSYFHNILKPIFIAYGLIIALITSCPKNSRDKTPLKYVCLCKKNMTQTSRRFKMYPLCEDCAPRIKPGPPKRNIQDFIDLLEAEGYSLPESERINYKNTKSVLNIIDPGGNKYRSSFGRFLTGVRSPYLPDEIIINEAIKIRERICRFDGCQTYASYGIKGNNNREYCKLHAPVGYVDVANRNKKCVFEGCSTVASYGIKGSIEKEYCKQHAPKEYIDIINKRCFYENCMTLPSYGIKGSNNREFC